MTTVGSVNHTAVAMTPRPHAPIMHFAGGESELDFDLVNKTGYIIKEVSIGPSHNTDWHPEDEVLKGREFTDGDDLKISFSPRVHAEHWDIRVIFAGDDDTVDFQDLKLTDISKVTLHYNKGSKETSATIE